MSSYDFDLFVIGGGSAGVRCARISAGHGARVGIAEQRFWGGTCVNVGCVPKKLMVNAAEYGSWADDAAAFGWEISKGAHDWAKFAERRNAEIARLSAIYDKLLQGAGVTTFEARASFVDAHASVATARHGGAHRLATGGRRRPADPGRRARR
jgi:glutathione reductase (NADPH)